ncbi:MAG TPA: hypothetical protein VFR51_05190 [Pyrinomonadaceae bacterium]|nr:hypothetical protein [Pyrinomonadaceae bacterium]
MVANTGQPFNIITGQDGNLDRQVNERPSFAGPNANCALSTIACTKFGNFNLAPLPGERIVPRNFGTSPASVIVNLRISRAFAFGTINRGNAAAPARPATSGPTVGVVGAGGGGDAKRVAAPGGPQGPGGAPAEKRFNLNLSLYIQNIFNHVNLGRPEGNLSSPNFGESLGLSTTATQFSGPGGGGSAGAGNRRVYAQLRLNF